MYKPPVSPSVAGCGPLSSTPTYSIFSTTPRSSLSSTPKSYGSNSSSFTNSIPSSTSSFTNTLPSSTSSFTNTLPSSLSSSQKTSYLHRPTRSSSLQPASTQSTPIPSTPTDNFLSTTPSSSLSGSFRQPIRPRFSPYFSPTLHIQEEEVPHSPLPGPNNTDNTNSTNSNNSSSRLSLELHIASPLLGKADEKSGDFEEIEKTGPSSYEQVILWLNLVIMFVSYFAFSALAPFWPDVATKCGLGAMAIGCVTSAYPLGMFCSSLVTGYIIPVVGTKNILTVALTVAAIFSIIFGSIPWFMCGFYDENLIFGVFLVIRFVQGMMAGVLETCIMFSISAIFPDRIGQILAYQELAIGVACMIGPLIGGLMYNLLHFFYTFVVFAVFFIVLLFLVFMFFPKVSTEAPKESEGGETKQQDEGGSLMAVMSGPLAVTLMVLFATAVLNSFMVPILPLYLDASFGWGPLLSGAVFGVSSLFYGVTATTVGHVTDNMRIIRSGPYKLCYAIGFGIQAVGYWLLGPLPFENIASPTTVFISFCLIGIGFAFCLIPTLPDMQLCTAITAGVDSDANKSVISGVWQATYAIAMAIGAPVAGVLYEQIGFFHSALICCVLALVVAVPSLICGFAFNKRD